MIGTRREKQRRLLQALRKSLGIVSTACRMADVSINTYKHWLATDEWFRSRVEDVDALVLDFAESKLHELIAKGNVASTIFFLKTRAKHRGYVERIETVASEDEYSKRLEIDQLSEQTLLELNSKLTGINALNPVDSSIETIDYEELEPKTQTFGPNRVHTLSKNISGSDAINDEDSYEEDID